jgi:hypothetical protein
MFWGVKREFKYCIVLYCTVLYSHIRTVIEAVFSQIFFFVPVYMGHWNSGFLYIKLDSSDLDEAIQCMLTDIGASVYRIYKVLQL